MVMTPVKVLIIIVMNNRVAIFSDIHIGVHQNSNFWLDISREWVKWFVNDLKQKDITDIIFCGDFFHYRDEISLVSLNAANEILDMLKDFKLYMITGNHDCYYKETSEVNSLSILKNRNNVYVFDSMQVMDVFDKHLTFCPWGTKVDSIPKSDVILGHFELRNFKMNAFKVCENGDDPQVLLSKAPLIISGHFHLRDERVFNNSIILYVGNPYEMDFGDAYQRKGYYILNLNNLEYEFIENTFTPKHIKIYLSKLITLTNIDKEFSLFIPNNIIKLVIDKNISSEHLDLLVTVMLSYKPNDLHVDYDVNYSKIKINEEANLDLSGVDITNAIEEFVNMLDINNKKEVVEYTISLYNRSKL